MQIVSGHKPLRYLPALLLVATLSGCFGSTPAALTPLSSPNGSLALTPSVNHSQNDPTKYLCVAFAITDSTGTRVHYVQSGASDTSKWAIGWYDEATVVLYSSDIGTYAWKLNEDQTISEIPHPLPTELKACGDRLKAAKYDR